MTTIHQVYIYQTHTIYLHSLWTQGARRCFGSCIFGLSDVEGRPSGACAECYQTLFGEDSEDRLSSCTMALNLGNARWEGLS